MENFQIDNLDRNILAIIKNNARTPFLEVGKACDVSGAAVHQRVHRLMNEGVIKGAEFILDPKKVGYLTCAYIGVFLEKASLYHEVAKLMERIPEIVECHYTTGNYSIFIKIYARDNEHLRIILTDQLQAIPGIARTETFISLDESFRRQLPV